MSLLKAFIKDAGFGVSVLLLALAIGVALVTLPIFGNKALIVRSGSMQPTIKVGDLVAVQSQKGLAVPQEILVPKYKVGDVIAFKDQKNPKIITTHRISSTLLKDGKVYYETRGDANNVSDSNLVWEENIIGNAQYLVKNIGKLFAFAKSKEGLVLMIIFPALMVIVMEAVNIFREFKISPRFLRRQVNLPNSVGFKVLIPLLAVILTASSTFAYFSNSATSTNNVFATAAIFTDHIVISEVQIAGATTTDDFIELYNPTASTISLNGFRLVMRTSSGTTDTNVVVFSSTDSIPSHSFLLWCNSGFASLTCDKTSVDTVSNNNSVALRNGLADSGTIIDALTIGSPINPLGEGTSAVAPAVNSSLERKALSTSTAITMAVGGVDQFKGNGYDTNNNSTDFVLRLVSQPQNSAGGTETP